jgi:hypothetical protein
MTEFTGETQRSLAANQNNIHHRVTETLRKTKSKAKSGAHGGGGGHGGVRFSGQSVLVASIRENRCGARRLCALAVQRYLEKPSAEITLRGNGISVNSDTSVSDPGEDAADAV